ncbi:hypothetical protein BD309DRAFT_58639 [Dichomitus squalens]|uniref:Uncharacterized protein n=2 Tax=Dichomitus squalens TaxID=114155 RepID=A0A4Q9NRG2_9APHY|nr:hypothetical protein BD309DRAFT_58639 [Dichomitus squalens]TBU54256.1 hypothetical protein BD310DRAFT_98055 [Dichomitus squalens]
MFTYRLDQIPKKHFFQMGPKKKASHTQPHKPFEPPQPGPSSPSAKRHVNLQARSLYNTPNPFHSDRPLNDITGQPLVYPRTTVHPVTGLTVRDSPDYPTPEEFAKMHAIRTSKPPNRFGGPAGPNHKPQASSSGSPSSSASTTPGPATPPDTEPVPEPTGRVLVGKLVDQLKENGLEPEDEIMLARLRQIDIQGRLREDYHNMAEACERAEALHPIHQKMVRFKQAGEKRRAVARAERERIEREVAERHRREQEEYERRRKEAWRLQREQEEERLRQAELHRLRCEREMAERERRLREQREEEERKRLEEQWRREWPERARQAELRRQQEEIERKRKDEEIIRSLQAARQRFIEEREAARQQEATQRLIQQKAEQERLAREQFATQLKVGIANRYDELWGKIKANQVPDGSIRYTDFPFPVFANNVPAPAAITYEAVEEFVFSSLRRGAAGKSRKEILKVEMLRWHPDKFIGRGTVLSKVSLDHRESVKEAADAIVRHLTILMGTN